MTGLEGNLILFILGSGNKASFLPGSHKNLGGFFGAWTMWEETHLCLSVTPVASFPNSLEDTWLCCSYHELGLGIRANAGSLGSSIQPFWVHWAGASQSVVLSPLLMPLADWSLPGWVACVLSAHFCIPTDVAFPLLVFKELRLPENKSQEGYLPIRNFWLFFRTKHKFISQWISPPFAWAGDWRGCSRQSVAQCFGPVPAARHSCWCVCHTPGARAQDSCLTAWL